ncbi:endo-1,4-beta-xylanase [Cellulomonas bogoriensis]|nr:endo-1,4-beta-xylanase [Cellulomonas bogoriensis]
MRSPATKTSSGRRHRLAVGALATALVAGTAMAMPAAANDTLKAHADAIGFDIGFALNPNHLNDSAFRQIADNEFNLVVAENAMKWESTQPNQGQYSWGQADQVADYATSQGKKLYGHTLAWHSQMPGWARNLRGTALRDAMIEHTETVAARYAGTMHSWDVVNEAFEGDGTRRQSELQREIGDEWIELAFHAARRADPNAQLCINDYSTDAINAKSTAIYDLVRDFQARGVPIDCVGFQTHLILGQVPSSMQENLQRFADLGLDVRVTELDIRMDMPATQQKLQQQADDYARVFEICLAVDRCQGVTVWGISDRHSWVPDHFSGQGAALMWDDNYNAKPAYAAVHDVLARAAGDSPTPTPTPTTPAPTPTTPAPTPTSPTPTTPPTGGACTAELAVISTWEGGFQAEVRVTAGSSAINGWSTALSLPSGSSIQNLWSGSQSGSGSNITVTNAAWNGSVGAGQTTSYGFVGSGPAPSGAVSCSAS